MSSHYGNNQMQQYISLQEQARQQLQKDSFILIDTIHRTISSAEKYALGKSNNKKYGYWDELDTANLRSDEELKREFFLKIQTTIGGLNEFQKLYPNIQIPFYDKIPKEVIIKDLEYYKNIVLHDKKKHENAKFYDMLIDILNGKKYNIISQQEFIKYIPKKESVQEEELREYATQIFNQKNYANNEVAKAMEQIQNNKKVQIGELGVKPGRGYTYNNYEY